MNLAGIIERDRLSNPDDCEACQEYRAGPAQADRRALLALLRETREALRTAHVGTISKPAPGCPVCDIYVRLAALAEP